MNSLINRAFPHLRAIFCLTTLVAISTACSTAANMQTTSGLSTDDEETYPITDIGDGTGETSETTDGSQTADANETTDDFDTETTDTEEHPSNDLEVSVLTPEQEQCDPNNSSTFSLHSYSSNTLISPAQTRSAITQKNVDALKKMPIHPWEFLNYYSLDYPMIDNFKKLSIAAEILRPTHSDDSQYNLQIRLQTKHLQKHELAPISLTLVLDTSTSMEGKPLQLLKDACKEVLKNLRPDDVVSIVTWDDSDFPLVENYKINENSLNFLLKTIDELTAQGGADLYQGLVKGFQAANSSAKPEYLNRLMLISDGGLPANANELELIEQHIVDNPYAGIFTLGIGVGEYSTYNRELMDSIAAINGGVSLFIDTNEDITQAFNTNFVKTFSNAIHDPVINLELPPGFQLVDKQGNPLVSFPLPLEPHYFAFNNTLTLHYDVKTCLDEEIDDAAKLTIRISYIDPADLNIHEEILEVPITDGIPGSPQIHKGSAILAYANSLAFWRDSWFVNSDELEAVFSQTREQLDYAQTLLPEDHDLKEIQELFTILSQTLNEAQ